MSEIVDKFGSSDFYVIVKKGNTELLNEINYAIDQMNAVEGDWKTTLYNKNYESICENAVPWSWTGDGYRKEVCRYDGWNHFRAE